MLVQFSDPACPQLGNDGLYELIVVPADGRVCTSAGERTGWRYHRYESWSDSRYAEIPRELISDVALPAPTRERFFVAREPGERSDVLLLPPEWR